MTKKDVEKTMLKRISVILLPILIMIGLLIYFVSSMDGGGVVPADFTAARQKAAAVSWDIVNLTRETGRKIELANRAENEGNFDRLSNLINEARSSNTIAYQKAFDLSRYIQNMAESLGGAGSIRQQMGYEAVAIELSLVSEFISYTESLNEFLNNVGRSILEKNPANQKAVTDSLNKVNGKVETINALNQNFTDKMAAFDRAS